MTALQRKRRIKRSAEDIIVDVVVHLVTFLLLVATIYPFWYVIVLSLNDGVDALRGGIYFWPRKFTFANYEQFLGDPKWIDAIFISVAKTLVGTGLTILFTCLVAYGLSTDGLVFRKFYSIILLICMYFSGGLIPYYLTLRTYGLLNKFWVYVIPPMFSTYYCMLAMSFFREHPPALAESARLDGAGEITIFLRIIMPLSKPLLATLGLFAAVSQWNAWSDTAFFAPSNPGLRSLAFLMRGVIVQNQVDTSSRVAMMKAAQYSATTATSIQMAAMIIAVLPIMCVYPFLQKHFVKGIMLGAVKG
ncbi:MAG: carbohydrate ABC transporter permease [Christensenellales bacterium]|jgi:putative aldouronate transport system permease protein|nr:carbohydrate ABC transporter permease [Clostridiales bacterium]